MKKRGISPLIATVLLIGFTVAMVAVAFIWGRSYIEEIKEKQGATSQKKLSCATDVQIEVQSASSSGNSITVTLENKGQQADGFVIRAVKGKDGENSEINQVLGPAEVKTFTASFRKITSPEKAEVIPKLQVARGVYQPCVDQKVTYNLK